MDYLQLLRNIYKLRGGHYIVNKLLKNRAKSLSKKWIERIELLSESQMPSVNWVIPNDNLDLREKIHFLDQSSLDVRGMYNNVNCHYKKDLFFASHFTNEYFFDPNLSTSPNYDVENIDKGVRIVTPPIIDTWIYLPSKEMQSAIYALDFDFVPSTDMHETLQICFYADSLAKRFRFNLECNTDLKFEIVDYGFFIYYEDKRWEKCCKHCTLPLNMITHVRVEVIDNCFAIYFNGKMEMAIRIKNFRGYDSNWMLLFWNGNNPERMDVRISNFKILYPYKNIQ